MSPQTSPLPEPRMSSIAPSDERRLVVALAGAPDAATLLRYAAYWAGPGEANPGRRSEGLLGGAVLAGTTAQGRDLFVTAPQVVQILQAPAPARANEELLRLTAEGGIDAVAVGERRLARELACRAPCSVWFVPDGAKPRARRLLVPTDLSVQAADSLRVAVTLARLSGAAECVALHVYPVGSFLTGSWGQQLTRQEAQEAFDAFMRPIDTLGVKVTPHFREAPDVATAINEAADQEEADLIVMSSRGRSWAASLLQPAVAERTLEGCRVPVLVVKHFGAVRGFFSLLAERLCGGGEQLQCN